MKPTPAYDGTRNGMKVCLWCGEPIEQRVNSYSVGKCRIHARMWDEDMKAGLHKQNRLRDLMLAVQPAEKQNPDAAGTVAGVIQSINT